MKKKSNKQYQKPHIRDFVVFIAEQYKLDVVELSARLVHAFPELKNKEKCANCGESMNIYEYKLDFLDSRLLVQMGKIVSIRLKKGMPFTEANKIHLPTEVKNYTLVSRQSQVSKLGLIAKVKGKDGRHDRRAGWSITTRGFQFLAGKPVPAKVQVFRNTITERTDELISIDKINYDSHSSEGIEFANYKEFKFDELENYSVVGFAQGQLL